MGSIPRTQRWVLVFNTLNGEDYARQLEALGAILAIPDPAQANQFLVIRDLSKRPANPVPEDLTPIQRIYWIDEKPQSVDSLARGLQLMAQPARFIAFFPEALEQKLSKLEHDYAGRAETEIRETRFELIRVGKTYEPKVVRQEALR
jgi:hypothetical protein